MDFIATSLSGLPAFGLYLGTALVLTIIFSFVYTLLTPHHEWTLIKENNEAASIAFSGSLIGFVLPLCSAIEASVNLVDMAVWGLVALVVQLVVYLLIRLVVMPRISQRIKDNERAAGIFLGVASIAGGLLSAASMSY
ncbi:DUF350 domain-containing protein [Parendozoicomonas haliclonae]|uniref:Inner membrane protein YjfL n=1 Tax=Parendozoicomonas haliclonae TaxID=1960125 RepID=A0A1X7ARI8_9GAMM|nr:DUF350 domain-containing protein [Parendozoicomonas haliclonae]SMA50752.1 hypothetical protein EHSB41UT_04569 [Parendozoicomonas haliclonae]